MPEKANETDRTYIKLNKDIEILTKPASCLPMNTSETRRNEWKWAIEDTHSVP
ncbi:MAG: hypothetical protein HC769_01450 [Cyanobacteria bacterium CRU_2_1]|nr:hypothetical protein [Cyanobacteria bacterium RU_5_0]NJR57630.1 hypothetical protein [Cyanobacteria bacterium CRU_2_1]